MSSRGALEAIGGLLKAHPDLFPGEDALHAMLYKLHELGASDNPDEMVESWKVTPQQAQAWLTLARAAAARGPETPRKRRCIFDEEEEEANPERRHVEPETPRKRRCIDEEEEEEEPLDIVRVKLGRGKYGYAARDSEIPGKVRWLYSVRDLEEEVIQRLEKPGPMKKSLTRALSNLNGLDKKRIYFLSNHEQEGIRAKQFVDVPDGHKAWVADSDGFPLPDDMIKLDIIIGGELRLHEWGETLEVFGESMKRARTRIEDLFQRGDQDPARRDRWVRYLIGVLTGKAKVDIRSNSRNDMQQQCGICGLQRMCAFKVHVDTEGETTKYFVGRECMKKLRAAVDIVESGGSEEAMDQASHVIAEED